MSKIRRKTDYPAPLIVPPKLSHKQTFIILHGRGSNAAAFGPFLLEATVGQSDTDTLASIFPHAKFVFPTASFRRAKSYKKVAITQWFDNGSLEKLYQRQEIMVDGLRESSAHVHGLLEQEIALVGAENVVLGGLSQGCATTLISLLLWEGPPLGAAFGFCGWLPFCKFLRESLASVEAGDDDDPFCRIGDEDDDAGTENSSDSHTSREVPAAEVAVQGLRKELDLEPIASLSLSFQRTPLFLGHGNEDEKVPVHLGRAARACIDSLSGGVSWNEYAGLGHWYSADMLADMVGFLKAKTAWASADSTVRI